MRRTVPGLVLVVLLSTVSCSSSGSTKVFTTADLKPAVLTSADVGSDYRETSTTSGSDSTSTDATDSLQSIGGSASCRTLFKQISGEDKVTNKVTRKFKRADGAELENEVTSASDNAKRLDQFRQVLSTCGSFSVTEKGTTFKVSLGKVGAPSLGDESLGLKMHLSGKVTSGSTTLPVKVDIFGVYLRRGTAGATVTITGNIDKRGKTVPVSLDDITPLAKKADAKLAKLA